MVHVVVKVQHLVLLHALPLGTELLFAAPCARLGDPQASIESLSLLRVT